MGRYVAFLRGMNLGGRRIRNEQLCGEFEAMGFTNVSAFLASGNIVFETDERSRGALVAMIEDGLREGLGYEVPTLLRSAEEVTAVASTGPFRGELGVNGGKPQVMLLPAPPAARARALVLGLATEADRLAFGGCELHWLPEQGISSSKLDLAAIEKAIGPTTTRTRNTLERLVVKYLA